MGNAGKHLNSWEGRALTDESHCHAFTQDVYLHSTHGNGVHVPSPSPDINWYVAINNLYYVKIQYPKAKSH